MKSGNMQTRWVDVKDMVQEVHNGDWGIPEFQRDFDWGEADIRALLTTIISGWPAGSLLLLEASDNGFRNRTLHGAPSIMRAPKQSILDGQQRVTSIYHALYGKGEHIFAIRWGLDEEADIDEYVISFRKPAWDVKYKDLYSQYKNKIIPFYELKTPSDFFFWRDELLDLIADQEERSLAKREITEFYSRKIYRLHEYSFPAVVLDRELEPAAIARIFERVNKSGMRLNAFDLMVAKTFTEEWNLRDKWQEMQEDFPHLSIFFGDDGMPILQSISLLKREDLRQAAVLQVPAQSIRGEWDLVGSAASQAIEFAQTRCGALNKELLPYPNMLPVLIGLAMEGTQITTDYDIYRWYWLSIFSGAFDVAANTRLVSHYKSLKRGNISNHINEEVAFDLIASTRRGDKALVRAVSAFSIAKHTQNYHIPGSNIPGPRDIWQDEISIDVLFRRDEFEESGERDLYFYSVLNTYAFPRIYFNQMRGLSFEQKRRFADEKGLGDLFQLQMPQLLGPFDGARAYIIEREEQIRCRLNELAFRTGQFKTDR